MTFKSIDSILELFRIREIGYITYQHLVRTIQHVLFITAFAILASSNAHSGQIHIATTFSKEVTDVYKKAYESMYSGDVLKIIQLSTNKLLPYLATEDEGSIPDIVWASDPGAFVELANANMLQSAPQVRNPGTPRTIGRIAMDGTGDLYFGQALSGYGLMFNTKYFRDRGIVMPRSWADVAQPSLWGHVLMSAPSRSGTTHLTVDTILQSQGWDGGWTTLLYIAGNCARITQRSFDVPDDVNNGVAGVGLVVDFFGLAGQASGYPVNFVYPKDTIVLPASIGMTRRTRNKEGASRFMSFALNDQGQALLYDPKISRMPATPFAAASMKVPSNFPNVYAVARNSPVNFNMSIYEGRRQLIAKLFDSVITRPHESLRRTIRLLHTLDEAKRKGELTSESVALYQRAKNLLSISFVISRDANDQQFISKFKTTIQNSELSSQEIEWTEQALMRYEQIRVVALDAIKKSRK